MSLALKLENLQVGGSAQVRGLLNAVLRARPDDVARGLVTVRAGGPHYGAAAAYIGSLLEVPVSLYCPRSVRSDRLAPLQQARGLQTIHRGTTWEASARYAAQRAASQRLAFLHPFADPDMIAGFGTVGLEIVCAPLKPSVVVVPAYTSGGELCGIAAAIKSLDATVRVVGVEAEGAARLHESLRQGRPASIVSLGPRRPSGLTFELAQRFVDEIVVVTETEIGDAVHTLWSQLEVSASATGATAVAAVLADKVALPSDGYVFAVVSGRGEEGLF